MAKSRLKARTCLVLPKRLPVVQKEHEHADAAMVTVGDKTYQCTRKPEAELTCDHCGKTGTMFGDAPEDFDICQKCYDALTVCVTIRWHKHPLTRHWMEGFQCDACLEEPHVHTRRPRSGRAYRLRLEAPWHWGTVPPRSRARARAGLDCQSGARLPEQG